MIETQPLIQAPQIIQQKRRMVVDKYKYERPEEDV